MVSVVQDRREVPKKGQGRSRPAGGPIPFESSFLEDVLRQLALEHKFLENMRIRVGVIVKNLGPDRLCL